MPWSAALHDHRCSPVRVLVLLVVFLINPVRGQLPLGSGEDDGRWLQQLYRSTNGTGWSNTNPINGYGGCSTGWSMAADANPCGGSGGVHQQQWNRIVCNGDGRVIEVHLKNCNLRGTLPDVNRTSGAMSQLQYISIYNNSISGMIPASFERLSNLRRMSMFNNSLNGTLPEALSNLSNLQEVYLSSNQLNGTLPIWFSSLPSLEVMYLDKNRFTGPLPSSWVRLRSMAYVSLSHNFITGELPTAWYDGQQQLANLSVIDLSYNCLNLATARAKAISWNWWLSKTSFGQGLQFQGSECECGLGQVVTTAYDYACEDCPPGYVCPNTSTRTPCPAGTYNPATGQYNDSHACLACPVGTTTNATGQSSNRSCNVSTLRSDSVDSPSALSITSSAVVIGAALPAALLSGSASAGGMLQRSLLQSRLASASCAVPLNAPMDPASSPSRLVVDDPADDVGGGFLRGAVAGNLLLLAAFGAVAAVAVLVHERAVGGGFTLSKKKKAQPHSAALVSLRHPSCFCSSPR